MAASTPYAQLVGTCEFYLAAASTAEPTVNTTPGGAWTLFGETAGEQTVEYAGDLTMLYDNDHQGPTKGIRPQEDLIVRFTLVGLTLENVARVLSAVGNVTSSAGPPAIKQLNNKRGYIPTEYALLMKGAADSPYGNFAGQNWFPRGVFTGAFTRTRAKDGRDAIECEYRVLEDDTQSVNVRLGRSTVQTS